MSQLPHQSQSPDKETVREITAELLKAYAPSEVELLTPILEKYYALGAPQPEPRAKGSGANDNALGFGGTDELWTLILLPIISATLPKLAEYTVQQIRDALKEGPEPKSQSSMEIKKVGDKIVIEIQGYRLTRRAAPVLAKGILELIAKHMSKT